MKSMLPSNTYFILSSIEKILSDSFSVIDSFGSRMELYPLLDYFCPSLFLKMTGYQEQKLKCICWELGLNNYEYRYELLSNKLGECSNLNDKNKVYEDIIKQIKILEPEFRISELYKNNDIVTGSFNNVLSIIKKSNCSVFFEKQIESFAHIKNKIKEDINLVDKKFLKDKSPCFEKLYRHRNRCAHNLRCYQQNLPNLSELVKDDYEPENYVTYFSFLSVIDNIFVELFKKYLTVSSQRN